MANILIDNVSYSVDGSKNVLATSLSLGLNLPYFCWHPALHSVGACRQCAILKYKNAEDKKGKIVMACLEPITDQLRISIEAPEARQFRAGNIEALMTNHPHDCPVCDEGGECHLQDMTVMTGHNCRRYEFKKRTHGNQYLGPFVNHEMNRCIQCYRCVRFYKDYAGGKDLDVFSSHDEVYFGRQEEGALESEFSGNLVEVCPTGVFTDKTLKKHFTRKWDLTDAPSICHQCGVGCNIIASERYGSIRRILTRYNGDVNGYFLCDRGRFGYEYVNSPGRISAPARKQNASSWILSAEEAIADIKKILGASNKKRGIGSPRASLESNFLLRRLVGPDHFYAGIPRAEGKLLRRIVALLKNGKVKTPSLGEVKDYDAVFIIGEDVTNTAPMLALNLRQTARKGPVELVKAMHIPEWNDAAVKDIVQGTTGPFYIATPHTTALDEIATRTYRAHPDDIARIAYTVAQHIQTPLPVADAHPTENPSSSAEAGRTASPRSDIETMTKSIADALLTAKKPLIVSGTSLYSQPILDCAAGIASALKDKGKDPGLVFIVPEANSIGLAMLSDQFLEDAFEKAGPDDTEEEPAEPDEATLIILENDLYERTYKTQADLFLSRHKNIVVLDSLENPTTRQATHLLPAATFTEADGTIINNEGRAQRFYQVYIPDNGVRSSWKWLQGLLADQSPIATRHFDGILECLVLEFPELAAIATLAPAAGFREGTQKIPREPHRYSGRTAMHANVNVNEPQPSGDADSALSFTMEGYAGIPPPALTPFYWSPGWNSVQAINKYQIEVGGPLHGGNPGKRLFEPVAAQLSVIPSAESSPAASPQAIPPSFTPVPGQWLVLPLYHIFGSDPLSAQSPAIKERMPQPYIALNDTNAAGAGILEGHFVEVLLNGQKQRLPVKLNAGLPPGTAGLPKGLPATTGLPFPFSITINSALHD
ncbi:MAG: NADH-quinone oxidoreductase subunit NuoG [Puia sp.]|nr:NADH-quinone oxidoreductase subunit NuoG [Puia sp.]